jgi:cytochrome c556
MKFWIAAAAVLFVAHAASAQPASQIVQERRDGLRRVGEAMEAIQANVQSRGDPRAMLPRIEQMQAFFSDNFSARFPAGTQQGAPGIESRALPAIWTDFAAFQRAEQGTIQALGGLRSAAASGDAAAFQAAFQATGPTCGACHRPFRAPAR